MAVEQGMYKYEAELRATAKKMATPGKGLIAADESNGTMGKRLKNINVENVVENRRRWRELLITSKGWEEYCSGIILFDETLYQTTAEGEKFIDIIKKAGVIPGIKVDLGTRAMPFYEGVKYTQGLTDLELRVAKYYEAGARFAKWRCVLVIQNGIIEETSIKETAWTLARYAAVCQRGGLVPIVEPEILMDGDHSLAVNQYWTEKTLSACYKALVDQRVLLEGTILKPNMCCAGKQCKEKNTFEANGKATVTALQRTLPAAVPGVTFLSGGQSEEEATRNLNAINKLPNRPWNLSFSFGRALQASALQAWQGKDENKEAAQKVFVERAKANSEANLGKYSGWAANEDSKKILYEKGYTY